MRESVDILDPAAAAVFAAARQRKILLAMVPEERSLSELARITDTPLNLLHHHIRKFIRLGLVARTREAARAGAPIRYYRATARAFFVPAELMPLDPGAALTAQLREQLQASLSGSVKGVVYSHDGERPRMRLVKDVDARGGSALELWLELRLTDADAAELAGELRALLQRFGARSSDSHRRYLVHAAIAPG